MVRTLGNKLKIFWVVISCSLVTVCQHFVNINYLHLQGWNERNLESVKLYIREEGKGTSSRTWSEAVWWLRRVWSRIWVCGICVGRSGTREGFLRVIRLSLQNSHSISCSTFMNRTIAWRHRSSTLTASLNNKQIGQEWPMNAMDEEELLVASLLYLY
jgi:hypothetical protein